MAFLLLATFPILSKGQDYVIVQSIQFTGNERTDKNYLQKTLPISIGDTIRTSDFSEKMAACKTALLNTKLFDSVQLKPSAAALYKDIAFTVKERWYLYPVPYAAIADRNFNEWWRDRNRDLSRLVFGAAITQKNLTGRNDDLYISAWLGFERRIIIDYELPYLSRSKRWGLNLHLERLENKNLAITTRQNQLIYWKSDKILRFQHAIELGVNYQPSFLNRHQLTFGLKHFQIADTVLQENADYLLTKSNTLLKTSITYDYLLDRRNYRGYPTNGFLFGLTASYQFLQSISNFPRLRLRYNHHRPIGRFHFSSQSLISLSTGKQPYVLQKGFGWNNDLVRGYNYQVIEGESYFIQKIEFGTRLSKLSININRFPNQFKHLWLVSIPKLFFDFGYVSTTQFRENGMLENQLLYSGGIGIDLLSYYDSIWRFEYALNNQLQTGLFLNFTLFIQ